MIGLRNAWMAARARNAARRGAWIAVIGGLASLAMLSALVSVPQQLDARLRRQIAALPVVPDSMILVRRMDSLRAQQRAGPRIVRRIPASDSAPAKDTTRADSALNTTAVDLTALNRAPSKPDSAAIDLMARITRARTAPLPDSYRALADAPMLSGDAKVRAFIDSIELVDREREAHAALGGPGARYAALTARLTELGQGLVRMAEQQLSRALLSSIRAPVRADSISPSRVDMGVDSVSVARRDSMREVLAQEASATESLLVALRADIAQHEVRRAALERRLRVDIPPVAMFVAALVVGLAIGYGVVLMREFRRPTVGDAEEIERLTAAPVLRHTREIAMVRERRSARRRRPGVHRAVDRESDTFVVLHLALTGVGDVVNEIDVLAADPVIGAAVALGLAATASRESRAVVVEEEPRRVPVLAHLLHLASGKDGKRPNAAHDALRSHVIKLERDASIEVRFGGSKTSAADLGADPPDAQATKYDLQVRLPDFDGLGGSDDERRARDVIVCVRQGATPLAWLSRAMQHARRRQQRVRAVVLWSRDVPAGS